MIFDGKEAARAIAESIREVVVAKRMRPTLAIVSTGDDVVTQKYLSRKRTYGESIGVAVDVHTFLEETSEAVLIDAIKKLAADETITGIVVQLPLPPHINQEKVLSHIPSDKDPDALGHNPLVLSPVSRAVAYVLEKNNIDPKAKQVVVIGRGTLVGIPVFNWFKSIGATVESVDEHTENKEVLLQKADIIVSGAGVPHLVTKDMVKEGVVLIDAGTSDVSGKLVGDIDESCEDKAALITPVPGGVGPVAVAMLFKNLLLLAERKVL